MHTLYVILVLVVGFLSSVICICHSSCFQVTSVLYGGPLDPWDSVVRSQVTERARQVVSSQLKTAKEATMQMVAKLASDITSDPK